MVAKSLRRSTQERAEDGSGSSSSRIVRLHREAGAAAEQSAVVLGRIVGLAASGMPLVTYPESPEARAREAMSTVDVKLQDIGREVTLVFVRGDWEKPVVSGILRQGNAAAQNAKQVAVSVEGQRLVLSAEEEVVIRCGKASIEMKKDGRVAVRGTSLLSRASGANRIKGGFIVLN